MPRLLSHDRLPLRRRPRRGSWAAFLVVAFGVFIGLFALAINQAYLWHTRDELRAGGDGAGLAAAGVLVDDEFLANDAYRVLPILQEARLTAVDFAAYHLVRGRPLDLAAPDDVAFGILSTPRGGQLTVLDLSQPVDPSLVLQVNTVRIGAGQTANRHNSVALIFGRLVGVARLDVEVASTVSIDRELRGFRPLAYQNAPVAPLALLSDPSGQDPDSWQHQVEDGNGGDLFRFERAQHQFQSGVDGLREFRALIATSAGQVGQSNTALLYFGTTSIPVIGDQIVDGLETDDLVAHGGELLLNGLNEVIVDGTQQGPAEGSSDLNELIDALEALADSAEARVWPLFTQVNAQGDVVVTGFVAARVVRVQPLGAGQPIEVILQPARLATATAVTAFDLRLAGVVPQNAYIGKVRVVE